MEVTTSIREDDGKTQVTVTVPADTVKEHIDAYYKRLAKTRIPGFRPGKAPRRVLDQNFGGHDAIFQEIATDMINDLAPVAVDGEDILFVTDPDFDEFDPIQEGETFTFSLFGKVKPEMELISYDPVEIVMPPAQATAEEVEAQIDSLREYYYSFETVEDRAVADGDFVMVSLECESDGKPIQGLNSESRLFQLGQGLMPASFDEQLIGMKPGETREFDFQTDGEEQFSFMGSDPIHAKVTLSEIRSKVVPELDEEFAKKVGVDSIDDLREKIREAIDRQKAEQFPRMKENRCVQELAKRLHGEVPVAYTNFTRNDLLKDFFNSLQREGQTFDQFLAENHISSEDFQKDLEQEAKEVAEQSLALDALFKNREMALTDEDIDSEFAVVDDPEATRREWEEAGRMSMIREACRRTKATQWLVETAIVKEETEDSE